MAGNLQPVSQIDFSGGLNAVSSPYLVGPKQVFRLRNMTLSEQGSLSTRDGSTTLTTSSHTVEPIVYIGQLNKVDGTAHPFAIQPFGGVNQLFDTTVMPWVHIGGSTTIFAIPQSVTMTDFEVIALGYQVPETYDGAALTFITAAGGQTVPPGAQHLAFHLGSLWLWNTNATTTALDGPSSLRMSDVNNFNSWPNANQLFIAKDDGQTGQGLATFTIAETGISPTQTLIAFKNYSMYQITGVFGASNFSVQKVKSDMGCVAPRTIQFVSGFGIIRLTHKGFALFNGVDDKLISEEIRPYIFGGGIGDIVAINQTFLNQSWASQEQDPPLYVAACPVADGTLTRIFLYDLVRKAWSICDFPQAFQSLALIGTATTRLIIKAGTSTGGHIIKIFDGDLTDDGVPIDWSFQTRNYVIGSHMRQTYWRRAIMDLLFTSPQPVSITTSLIGLTPALVNSRTYSSSFTPPIDGRQDVDIMRTCPSVSLNVSGTGAVSVRGIELQGRSKPLTKAVL